MTDLAKYVLRLETESARYKRGLDQANRRLERFERQNRQSLERVKKSFISLGAVVGAALAARELVRFGITASDTMTLVESRIKLVTDSVEELNSVQERLFRVAQETRSAFAPTVELYARVARSTKELGISQQEVIDLTRTVNQAIQISGATAQEASAGVIQFAQALASGELRGEELRSVMEQLSGLSLVLARGLGVGVGELRDMAEAGELTTSRILEVLRQEAPAVADEFAQITPTIASAFQTLQNSLLEFIDDANDATGAGNLLADTLMGVADAVTELGNIIDPGDVTRAEQIKNELEELRDPSQFDLMKQALSGIADLVETIRGPQTAGRTAAMTLGMSRIQELKAELAAIEERAERMRGLSAITVSKLDTSEIEKFFDDWEKDGRKAITRLAQQFQTEFATSEQQIAKQLAEFEMVVRLRPEMFSPEEVERITREIKAQSMEGLEFFDLDEIEARQTTFLRDRAQQLRQELDRIKSASEEIGLTFASAFEDAIVQAKSLRDIVQGLLQDILRILVRKAFTEPLADFVGGLFDGKAMGGPVAAGTPYVVGEQGPEVFVPAASGRIVPNHKLGGGVTVIQHNQIGLPPQWQAQLMTATQMAAAVAKESMSRELGGRR